MMSETTPAATLSAFDDPSFLVACEILIHNTNQAPVESNEQSYLRKK